MPPVASARPMAPGAGLLLSFSFSSQPLSPPRGSVGSLEPDFPGEPNLGERADGACRCMAAVPCAQHQPPAVSTD